jgi:hypothetical protein
MHVADFHRDSGTVLVRTSKAAKIRHIELTLTSSPSVRSSFGVSNGSAALALTR